MVVGSVNGSGYIGTIITTDGKRKSYRLHRLIWLLVYGYFPENVIDHINKDKTDNRIENLREVSQRCNLRNGRLRKNSLSGVKGVRWYKLGEIWGVCISTKYIGYSKDLDEAVAMRLAAEQCLGWLGCDVNSTALKYMQNYVEQRCKG